MKPTSLIKTAFLAVFLFSASQQTEAKIVSENPKPFRESPREVGSPDFDFAFPQTAYDKASTLLPEQLKDRDYNGALNSAIVMTIAADAVSNSRAGKQIELLDSLRTALPSPYNSLAALIEAQLYSEIYNSGARKYSSRVELVREDGADESENSLEFLEWDRNKFRQKIFELTGYALKECEPARDRKITEFSPVVSYSEVANNLIDIDSGFTIYDFVIYKTIDLRSRFTNTELTIPFFKNTRTEVGDSTPSELIDLLIEFHKEPCDALAYAIIRKSDYEGENKARFLWGKIEELRSSDCVVPIIWTFNKSYQVSDSDSPVGVEEYCSLLREISERSGNGPDFNAIENILSGILRERVYLRWEAPFITNRPEKINIEYSNIENPYILIYKPLNRQRGNTTTKISEIPRHFSLERAIPVKTGAESPIVAKDSVFVTFDSPGYYAVVVSRSDKLKDVLADNQNQNVEFIHISDIHTISSADATDGTSGLYVVSARDSKPIGGSTVTFSYGYPKKKSTHKTDREGYASFKGSTSASATALYKGSEFENYVYRYRDDQSDKRETEIRIFTDLGLYHPGDKVLLSGIVFSHTSSEAGIIEGFEGTLKFMNPSYEEKGRVTFTSGKDGRFDGEFTLPQDCNTGNWSIILGENGHYLANFDVAEYKAPTFFISIEQKESGNRDYSEFEGLVSTYSGMPLPGLEVDYTISYRTWRPWLYTAATTYGDKVTTDENGKFTIKLPLDNIKDTSYRFGVFTLSASATSEAGETAFSNSVSFGISNSEEISVNVPNKIDVSEGQMEISAVVKDVLGYPVREQVRFELSGCGESETLLSGEFMSPVLTIDTRDIPSGQYRLRLISPENRFPTEERDFILFRNDDPAPPIETPLWVPRHEYINKGGEKEAAICFGSSFKGQYILVAESSSDGKVSRKWIKATGKNEILKIAPPEGNERKFVTFLTCRDHRTYQEEVTLIPEVQAEKLKIETQTFRDRLTPGEQEKWSFRITVGDIPASVPAMAVMTNKALDAIRPFEWPGSIFTPYYNNPSRLQTTSVFLEGSSFSVSQKYLPVFFPSPLMWVNTYGQPLYVTYFGNNQLLTKSRATAKMATANSMSAKSDYVESVVEAPMMDMAMASGVTEEASAEGGMDDGETMPEDSIEIRDIEMPSAFFKPNLHSDSNGILDIDFTVPDFNTEWKLQIFAYTPDVVSGKTSMTATASKKVMVQMAAPRFLRTGDDVELRATLFNNSDAPLPIEGKYEIFDAATGKIVKEEGFPSQEIPASGNRVISIAYHCPDNISSLGIRAYARSGASSDGEQTVIPVLPSSQPVIESTPFYLQPDQTEFSVKLPSFKATDRITLDYTDNPMWSVLTALPSLKENRSETLLWNLSAFYADCVGYGLIKSYPHLREGLGEIIEGEDRDSLMISNLYKNQDTKIVSLNSTPWVNDAFNETLRLSLLRDLLDDKKAESAIYGTWRTIMQLQNPDGGWSWYKSGESSRWMTTTLLFNLGMLNRSGFLYPGVEDNLQKEMYAALDRGFSFCEKEINRDISRWKDPDKYPYASLKTFILAGRLLPEIKKSESYDRLEKKVVKALIENWKKETIYDKATTAMLLWRTGREGEAGTILESLRQFASYDADKGMWFDNLGSSYQGAGKLLTTARVLQAFQEIEPKDPAIDRLRQWLLIQRQTQDWDEGLFSVEVINAMLTSVSRWAGEFGTPEITIGDYIVPTDKAGKLTGYIKVNLNPEEISGKTLRIKRTAPSPAWGGVVSQFVAPMKSVKAVSIPDLKIEKEYRILTTDGNGTTSRKSSSFKVGDKVRVTMTISCDRDLDYVALTDERSACLEPTDQLSGFRMSDQLGFYREVKNSATNMYFYFLPKGTHIITYDCAVSEAGTFASGIATLQSQYSPLITAHSKGEILKVED